MSVDIEVVLTGKKIEDVLGVIKKHRLGVEKQSDDDWSDFYVAGFGYKAYEGSYYTEAEVAEAKEEGHYESRMDTDGVRLSNTTNMGWSYYGDTRQLQVPVAEMLAQSFAMYLNCVTFVYDPQSGKTTYYRRKDTPEVHDLLEGRIEGFRGDNYENFCEVREGEGGEWEELGWRRRRRQGQNV